MVVDRSIGAAGTSRPPGIAASTEALTGVPGMPGAGGVSTLADACNGAPGSPGPGGVAMSTWMGKQLSAMTAGEKVELGLLAGEGFNPIALHAFRAPGVRLAAGWQQFLDVIGR